MALPTMRPGLTSREFLRIAGGYGAPAAGDSPAGGLDVDNAGNLATDGAITVDGDVAVGGALALAAGGTNKLWSHYIAVTEMITAGASSPVIETFQSGDVLIPVMDFAAGVEQGAAFSVGLPADYDGSALRFTLYWSATAGTSGSVKWHVLARVFANDESLAQVTTGGGTFTDDFIAQNDLHAISTDFTPAGATAGSLMTCYLRRFGQQDSFDATARLIGVRIAYT